MRERFLFGCERSLAFPQPCKVSCLAHSLIQRSIFALLLWKRGLSLTFGMQRCTSLAHEPLGPLFYVPRPRLHGSLHSILNRGTRIHRGASRFLSRSPVDGCIGTIRSTPCTSSHASSPLLVLHDARASPSLRFTRTVVVLSLGTNGERRTPTPSAENKLPGHRHGHRAPPPHPSRASFAMPKNKGA